MSPVVASLVQSSQIWLREVSVLPSSSHSSLVSGRVSNSAWEVSPLPAFSEPSVPSPVLLIHTAPLDIPRGGRLPYAVVVISRPFSLNPVSSQHWLQGELHTEGILGVVVVAPVIVLHGEDSGQRRLE